jgi:protein ImuB
MWPIERLRRHTPSAVPDDAPLALVESGARGIRITAVNAVAAREGVRVGTALADARAGLPTLLSRPAEPVRDRTALMRLARWAGRYGPSCNVEGEDGLWIDVTGATHLFGGEEPLLDDLLHRLARFGLTARVAVAGTPGAVYALARFGALRSSPPGRDQESLAPLPVEALRLDGGTVVLLKRLGLRRIGALYDLPRASLERRFSSEASSRSKAKESARLAGAVLLRLDQALGLRDEPRRPLGEAPLLEARRTWGEPLISSEALEAEVAALAAELGNLLKTRALGCRRIRLTLYRADGTVAGVFAGLARASCEAAHFLRLMKEKLAVLDAGFGIDVAVLGAFGIERLGADQSTLATHAQETAESAVSALVDRLANRLGTARVACLVPHESHIPEHAERRGAPFCPAPAIALREPGRGHRGRRPPFLLSPPEPIRVMAEVPEGPPRHFTWRRVRHRVVKAEGPERIAPEWWRFLVGARDVCGRLAEGESQTPTKTRDYYRLEDESGARFWVYREGAYQSAAGDGVPLWFMHGLFG